MSSAMSASTEVVFDNDISDSVWSEVAYVFVFVFGFAFVRYWRLSSTKAKDDDVPASASPPEEARLAARDYMANKQQAAEGLSALSAAVESEAAAGHGDSALALWRTWKALHPTPVKTLKVVVKALLDFDPPLLVDEILEHLAAHEELRCPAVGVVVLDIVGQAGCVQSLDALYTALTERLQMEPVAQIIETVLSGYAAAGCDRKHISEFNERVCASGRKLTARGHSIALRGLLASRFLDGAIEQVKDMRQDGFVVPAPASQELLRVARDQHRLMEVLEPKLVPLTVDSVELVLEHSLRHSDLALADLCEAQAASGGVVFTLRAKEAWLKLLTSAGDERALQVFKRFQTSRPCPGDLFCVALLLRCAESSLVVLADEIAGYLRTRGKLSLAFFGNLLKVYEQAGLYEKACDLYRELLSVRLSPDHAMCSQFRRCAAKCDCEQSLVQELANAVAALGDEDKESPCSSPRSTCASSHEDW
jgi:pentatricopeptide repeat protein